MPSPKQCDFVKQCIIIPGSIREIWATSVVLMLMTEAQGSWECSLWAVIQQRRKVSEGSHMNTVTSHAYFYRQTGYDKERSVSDESRCLEGPSVAA